MRVAGVVSLLIAILLIGSVGWTAWQDSEDAPERLKRQFSELNRGDNAQLDRELAERREEGRSENYQMIAGGGFLVAGIVLIRKRG